MIYKLVSRNTQTVYKEMIHMKYQLISVAKQNVMEKPFYISLNLFIGKIYHTSCGDNIYIKLYIVKG